MGSSERGQYCFLWLVQMCICIESFGCVASSVSGELSYHSWGEDVASVFPKRAVVVRVKI